MPYLKFETTMEELIILELITFIFYCFDCYVVKRNMRPDTTKKELITLFAGILGGGILIILMMYYAYINLNFFSWYISPVALIPLFFVLLWQLAVLKPGAGHKILSSYLLIITYVLFLIVGIFAGPEISGISLYHG